jgi:alkanesulfonate monooxygenase
MDKARRGETTSGEFVCGLLVFTTTPASKNREPETYLAEVAKVAQWSDAAGCEGTLVYTDNGLLDPWLVSHAIISCTERLCPLVAVQPVYMHPYTAAKMVASLAFMHGRRAWLNIVAGGFVNDLVALGDDTPHDERYERVSEYASIMLSLLANRVTTVAGRYYGVKNLRLSPPLPEALAPGLLISGSSAAGLATARTIGAVPVKYPKPPGEERAGEQASEFGVRIGIIARDTEDEAWRVAHARFPEDRKGQIAHRLAMKVSDSRWHHQLSGRDSANGSASAAGDEWKRDPYWLGPFQNYGTFCPYLVGSYEHVAELVAGYIALGARVFILDIPSSAEDLEHIRVVLRSAVEAVT